MDDSLVILKLSDLRQAWDAKAFLPDGLDKQSVWDAEPIQTCVHIMYMCNLCTHIHSGVRTQHNYWVCPQILTHGSKTRRTAER